MVEVSYWDAAVAEIAGAAAAAAAGAPDAAARRERLAAMIERTADVVIVAYATEVLNRIDGRSGRAGKAGSNLAIGGWRDLARRLVPAGS
jgi:hypothetical protein